MLFSVNGYKITFKFSFLDCTKKRIRRLHIGNTKSSKMDKRPNKLEEAQIVLEILNRIPYSPNRTSAEDIIESLGAASIHLSKRSVQRYLKRISESDSFGVERDSRDRKFGYSRNRSENKWETLELKPNECLLLKLAQEYIKNQVPGSILKSLDFLFAKADKVLNEKHSNRKEKEWLQKVALVSPALPQLPAKILPRIFDEVSNALFEEKKLRIRYKNMHGVSRTGIINPLGLVQQQSRLYLVCTYENDDKIFHLALHRIKSAKMTDFSREVPKDFRLSEYLNSRHFNYSDGEKVRWVLEFTGEDSARNFEETPFAKDQVLKKLGNGKYRLEVVLQDSRLLDGWIATYGDLYHITKERRYPL